MKGIEMEWSPEKILFFIEQYRKKPVLWDPQDAYHYNKYKKLDVWQQLANECDITPDECRRKITSLLASLRREKARMVKSKGTGKGAEEVFVSSWFAYKHLQFVLDRNKPRPTADSIEAANEIEESVESIENEKLSETVSDTDESVVDKLRPSRAKKMKKTAADEMMASAFTILRNAAKNPEPRTMVDECESYGAFLCNKLRNYSRSTRNIVQHHISDILFYADQGYYDTPHTSLQAPSHQPQPSTSKFVSSFTTTPQESPQSDIFGYGNEHSAGNTSPATTNSSQSTRHVEEHTQEESQGFIDEFSDLIQ